MSYCSQTRRDEVEIERGGSGSQSNAGCGDTGRDG